MSATPPHDPSIAIQEMQKLDDIEADLADTALAVAAIDEDDAAAAAAAPSAEAAQQPQLSPAEAATSADALVQNAEAIEQVLEQAIPAAPEHSTGHEASQSATPLAGAASSDTPIPSYPTPSPTPGSAVAEVHEAFQAVAADVNVPILPETVVPPAQSNEDTDMDAQTVQADVSTSVDDAVPPISSSTDAISPSSKPMQIPSGAGLPPRPEVAEPGTSVSLTPVKQESQAPPLGQAEYAPADGETKPLVEIDMELPEGLDSGSTSIRSNPDLVRAWARGELNMSTF
jgi:hypothetical protein